MSGQSLSRGPRTLLYAIALGVAALGGEVHASGQAQDNSTAPASVPAGVLPAGATAPKPALKQPAVSAHQAREADNAYLEGARQLEHDDLAAAEKSFAHAVELDPGKPEYLLSLSVAREHRLTELVQAAAKARALGQDARADSLLAEAHTIDPDNPVITQHLVPDAAPPSRYVDNQALRANPPSFDGAIEFAPNPGKLSLHHGGGAEDVIRSVYRDFGITVTFDSTITSGSNVQFDLDNADFATATHVLDQITHTFAVPVQPKSALLAKDTQENRDRLAPLVEETVYLPGLTQEAMTDMANLARNIFDLKQVTASPTGGDILLRGDERTLNVLNATWADMLDGGSDVLLDIHFYEIDKTHMVSIGATLPTGAGIFPVATELQSILNSNSSVIQQAVSAGVITLTGNAAHDIPLELGVLSAAGDLNIPQLTGLLGVFGTYGALPLAGLYLATGSTFNLLLNASDARTLDEIELRAGDGKEADFRAGTRYPIVTSTYSSGISSSLASSLSGLKIGGTSVSSLLSAASSTVPQVQYEDLGITIKATPNIQRSGEVNLKLDMKIEALGGGTINAIPILNNRAFTSTITIPLGQTAMLASVLTRNEMRDIDGVPGLSELPGFQGTDKDNETDSGELLITITPHPVRTSRFRIASRRLAVDHASNSPQ